MNETQPVRSNLVILMMSHCTVTVLGAHAAAELASVIVGGVKDVPGETLFEEMECLRDGADSLRRCLLSSRAAQ
jgi:proline racemase